jgi:hypothetical protein
MTCRRLGHLSRHVMRIGIRTYFCMCSRSGASSRRTVRALTIAAFLLPSPPWTRIRPVRLRGIIHVKVFRASFFPSGSDRPERVAGGDAADLGRIAQPRSGDSNAHAPENTRFLSPLRGLTTEDEHPPGAGALSITHKFVACGPRKAGTASLFARESCWKCVALEGQKGGSPRFSLSFSTFTPDLWVMDRGRVPGYFLSRLRR